MKIDLFLIQMNRLSDRDLINTQEGTTDEWLRELQKRLHWFGSNFLVRVLYKLKQYSIRPTKDWINTWFDASICKLQVFKQRELRKTIYLLSKVSIVYIPPVWIQEWFRCSAYKLPTFSSLDLTNCIQSIANLEIEPPKEWFDIWYQEFTIKINDFNNKLISVCFSCIASLGIVPFYSSVKELNLETDYRAYYRMHLYNLHLISHNRADLLIPLYFDYTKEMEDSQSLELDRCCMILQNRLLNIFGHL